MKLSGRSLRYSRKSLGIRMEPWGTPELTRYSWKDFPSGTTTKLAITEKRWGKAKHKTRNSRRFLFLKKTSMPHPVESLGYINIHSSSSPRFINILAVLWDTTVRRSAVNWEDLKPFWKLEKWLHFLSWSSSLLLPSFSKILLPQKED